MTAQYLRKLSLTVDSAGTAYDLSLLHIKFSVFSATLQTLKYCTVRIYNLSKNKANALFKEFTTLRLSAGYEGSFGLIFAGQIARTEMGKENATDSYVEIFAQDGDEAKLFGVTNATLASGWTDEDLYNQLMTDFQSMGLQAGFNPGLIVDAQGARGRVLYGPTANYMDELANRQGCEWFIEDGRVNLLPVGMALPGLSPLLTPRTGLIGVPRVTINGVEARCLLNSNIRTGGLVVIDNSAIAQLNQQTPPTTDPTSVIPTLQGKPDGSGTYKAHCVTHNGDSRGLEWYTGFIGISVDSPGPAQGPTLYDVPSTI